MNTIRILALVLLGSLALGGCTETRFAAPLGDNIETCDTRWKGLWLDAGDEADHKHTSTSGFYVDAGCQVEILDQPEPGGPLKRLHIPVNFVHDGGTDYIVVSDAQVKGLVELDPPYAVKPLPEKSFFFLRYRISAEMLELYEVDTPAVARLVLDEKLKGTVSKTSSELHVWVDGDRAAMLELVRTQPIFQKEANLVLKRSKLSLADYERILMKPAAKTPRKKH